MKLQHQAPHQDCFTNPTQEFWKILQWEPSTLQLQQLKTLQVLLRRYNQKVNLTRLIEGEDYWISQVFDSLWPLKKELNHAQKSLNCIDVGSGCGFPGLAIAIALPNSQLTLVDALRRKTNILKMMVKELRLEKRVQVISERIELTGQKKLYRSNFDLALARAVAPAPVTAEYLIPLLKHKGEALLYRGKWNDLDHQSLTKALSALNATLHKIQHIELPSERGIRHLIRLKANASCPKTYPRSVGIPSKRPLSFQIDDNLC